MTLAYPTTRLRRLRQTPAFREMFQETEVRLAQLIYPIFVEEEVSDYTPIASMPGVQRIPEKQLAREIEVIAQAGIKAVMLFGISHHKDATGSETWRPEGLLARIIRTAKQAAPELMVKPALAYLDIIQQVKAASLRPLAAYQVSGEYAMIKFAAQAGAIDEKRMVRETLGAIKRAGADQILTYFALDIAREGF